MEDGDIKNLHTSGLLPAPNVDKPQETPEQVVSEEPSSREDFEETRKMEEGDIKKLHTAGLLLAPNVDKPQETLEQIVSEEPSLREDFENETSSRQNTILDEYRASKRGDRSAAKAFLEKYPNYVGAPITEEQGTALQLTADERINFLLHTIQNDWYDIALEILKKDKDLTMVTAATRRAPCVWIALEELARKPFAIDSKTQLSFWKTRLNSWHKGIHNKALMRKYHQLVEELVNRVSLESCLSELVRDHITTLLVEAAKVGNILVLKIVLARCYPNHSRQLHEAFGSLIQNAIMYRQQRVVDLIYEIEVKSKEITTYIDKDYNNILHYAGKLAPLDRLNTISSIAAVQIQRELLWFKKVEKIVPPLYVNMKNKEGLTPKDIFIRKHHDVREKGERWIKETSNYCLLVATLIATVVYAAIFTVPGGNDQTTGKPIFLKRNWFTVFFISYAIALVFSLTSILIFLSILTSRYRDDDFLKSIPLRLLFGLAALFISIAGMGAAFTATCYLVYYSKAKWAPIVITALAPIPIIFFVLAQVQLWIDTIQSIYWSDFFSGYVNLEFLVGHSG